MLLKLLALFVSIPLLEIIILLEVGARLGTLPTVLILVGTAVGGATLAHREGLKTLWRLQEKMAHGIMPEKELLDGLLILVAGMLLLTPGLLTDTVGLLLLMPVSRQGVKRWLRARLGQRLQMQQRMWDDS